MVCNCLRAKLRAQVFWLTSELCLFLFSSLLPIALIHLKGPEDSQLKRTECFNNGIASLLEPETQQEVCYPAFMLIVSRRAVRMRLVTYTTSELAEMQGHESSHLILGTGMGMGLSKQKTIEKPNCSG